MCVDIHVHIYKRVEARGQPQVIFYSAVHLVLGWLASEFSTPQGWSCQRVHPHLAFFTRAPGIKLSFTRVCSKHCPLTHLSRPSCFLRQSGTELVMKWRMVLILNACLSCLSPRNPGIVGTFCCVPSLCSMWFEVGALCVLNPSTPLTEPHSIPSFRWAFSVGQACTHDRWLHPPRFWDGRHVPPCPAFGMRNLWKFLWMFIFHSIF